MYHMYPMHARARDEGSDTPSHLILRQPCDTAVSPPLCRSHRAPSEEHMH